MPYNPAKEFNTQRSFQPIIHGCMKYKNKTVFQAADDITEVSYDTTEAKIKGNIKGQTRSQHRIYWNTAKQKYHENWIYGDSEMRH